MRVIECLRSGQITRSGLIIFTYDCHISNYLNINNKVIQHKCVIQIIMVEIVVDACKYEISCCICSEIRVELG